MRKKAKTLRRPKRTPRGSPFTDTIYAHIRPESRSWLKRQAELFGSESAVIDALISKARGVKEVEGYWLPKNSFTRKVRLNSLEV